MRRRPWRAVRLGGALAVLTLGAWTAHAQEADPPGRAARLSDAQGSVSLQPAGMQEWIAAPLNRPLTTGDRLWSDANARAELDLGAAVVRLGSMTGFSFLNLDDNSAQLQLTAGTLIVRVRDMRAGDNYEIDTPNLALTLQQPGEYRVEVNEAGDTTVVKVSEGLAQAAGGGQQLQVGAQQRFTFTGGGELTADAATLGAPDDLDAWSAARERQLEDSPSRDYVADEVAGTQDLDDNGQWQQTPDYGYVWSPTVVVAGWAPYRFGQWVWVGPWGWTWVDDARWGYAPFHYGRWVSWNHAWCWVPGPRNVRPVYAPALVGWVHGPGGGPLTVSGNHVAWFPLAPREVYVPGYHVSPAYARNVNITNTTIINNTNINLYTNTPANQRYANNTTAAVTSVPQDVFTSGQRLNGHTVRLPPAVLSGAVAGAVAPAIVPNRQSVLGPAAPHSAVHPPPALLNRPVLARTPLPRAPAPFDRQVSAMQANGGRPLARSELERLQPPAVAVPVRMVAAPPAHTGGGAAEHALQISSSPGSSHGPRAPSAYAVSPGTSRPQGSLAPAPVQGQAPRYDRPANPTPAQPRAVVVSEEAAHGRDGGGASAAPHSPTWSAPPIATPQVTRPQGEPQHYHAPAPVMSAPPPVHEAAAKGQAPAPPVPAHPQPPPAPAAPRVQPAQPGAHDPSPNR